MSRKRKYSGRDPKQFAREWWASWRASMPPMPDPDAPRLPDRGWADLRGGPADGERVKIHGIFHEVPAPEGSEFEFHVYSWQKDEDGTIYGRWEEEANV